LGLLKALVIAGIERFPKLYLVRVVLWQYIWAINEQRNAMTAEKFTTMMNDSKVLRVLDSLLWMDADVTRRAAQAETVRRTDDEAAYAKSLEVVTAEYQNAVEVQAQHWGLDVGFVVALMNEREETKRRPTVLTGELTLTDDKIMGIANGEKSVQFLTIPQRSLTNLSA
jgi:hypothetical protein